MNKLTFNPFSFQLLEILLDVFADKIIILYIP